VENPFRLDGKAALVTGAARGIGRATALALARAGASIAVLDLPKMADKAERVAEEIGALGRTARCYAFDVTDIERIPALVEDVVADFGALDILVNNAGTSDQHGGLDCTPEEWDAILTLNLKSMFFFCQAAAKQMVRRGGGRIVNLGSSHGLIATGSAISYKASKGGVHSLTRELAFEWVRLGINVNAVAPGPVETPLILESDAALGRTGTEVLADMQRRVPLGRRLLPEEIAAPIVFLASPAAAAIVGHVLVIDGGQTIF
jgi:NAD(P)-dependent dehydrogenase (short-subunit alcohol dehydrogenase family)